MVIRCTPECFSVVRFASCYSVVLHGTRHDTPWFLNVLCSAVRYSVMLNVHWYPLKFPMCFVVLHNTPWYSIVLRVFPWYSVVFSGTSQYSVVFYCYLLCFIITMALLVAPWCFLMLRGAPSDDISWFILVLHCTCRTSCYTMVLPGVLWSFVLHLLKLRKTPWCSRVLCDLSICHFPWYFVVFLANHCSAS